METLLLEMVKLLVTRKSGSTEERGVQIQVRISKLYVGN